MHEVIRAFQLEGEMSSSVNRVEHKDRLVHHLEIDMRDEGYVPILDLEPQLTLDYVSKREIFGFKLTVYGAETKGDPWETSGIASGVAVPRLTQNRKSSPA